MIKEIPVSELKLGMYIAAMSNRWIPGDNSRQEGMIRSEKTLTQIRALGVDRVYIDSAKGLDSPAAKPLKQNFDEALCAAADLHNATKQLVNTLLEDAKSGTALALDEVKHTADQMTNALQVNSDAMLCMTRIRHKDEYLLEHSVNVATMMGILAKAKGYNNNTQRELIMGGLLHDIGKILVPDSILHKAGKLTADEWEEMKRHVQYGQEALARTPGVSPIVKSICGLHHERLDGSGYPLGLEAQEISTFGRMASIVDVYDAITADRVYHQGMSPTDAMRKLVDWSGNHLDKELVYQFIRTISIYPSGSVVELDNGLVGFVSTPNHSQPDRPVVDVFFNTIENKTICQDRIDLSCPNGKVNILRPLDEKELGVRLDDVIVPKN